MAARATSQAHKLKTPTRDVVRYERLAWLRRLPIKDDTVFYESFSGNGVLCNPEAIFRELLAAGDMGGLRHVWALSDPERHAAAIAEFAGRPGVKFVRPGSAGYDAALATSKYLVNNATFPQSFGKRPGQVYLNTWHGTPLKAMGYDVPAGALATHNVARNFLACDYLLAPNDATEQMYVDAYRMRNVFRGSMICEGTPRVDRQFASEAQKGRIRDRMRAGGAQLSDSQQIVLYAPTWRGDFYAPTNDIQQLRGRIEALRARIDTDRYCVLLKVHQQVYQFAAGDPQLRPVLVSNEIPANDALAVTDVLITDYSSIFIDFLATGRPVLFLAPDLADYEATRGLNLAPEQWPGPICRDLDELVDRLKHLGTGTEDDPQVSHAAGYAAARERYCPREDGHAAQRIVDIVFRGKTAGYDIRSGFTDGRQTILIYLGGMIPNGITASALSLLDNVDYDRFDVSAFFAHTSRPERRELINQINPNVRILPRSGGMLASKAAIRAIKVGSGWAGHRSHEQALLRHRRMLREEWVRCFGDSQFDHIIDFSGYGPFWGKILLQGETPSFSIWMHNDLKSDADREVDGRRLHQGNLHGVFELYQYAQHLVSVSPSLATINQGSLSAYADPTKFTSARNTVNYHRILRLAYGLGDRDEWLFQPAARDLIAKQDAPDMLAPVQSEQFRPDDLRGSIDKLMAHHDIDDIVVEARRRAEILRVLPPAPGVKTFVTVGRLSPEKNHTRLIRAFDLIHQEDANTRLVVLGTGPLRADLGQLVAELGLSSSVTLAGHLSNPYGVMAQSDCFVLSSDYEGQPMVILEALVLGLPVVTTRFASVSDALPKGSGLVVAACVDSLAGGMRAFLRGDVNVAPFDYVAYNREATEEFYRAIGVSRAAPAMPADRDELRVEAASH